MVYFIVEFTIYFFAKNICLIKRIMTIRRAFLVGINYRGTQCELSGCINDILMIKDLLINNYGYDEQNILIMSDDTVNKPTAMNILNGWKWLISNTSSDDFGKKYIPSNQDDNMDLFFHYSGHGSQVRDTNGDEEDGKDETICPIDFMSVGMITDDLIREKLVLKVPSNSKLVSVIDACHSESAFDLLWTVKTGFFGGFSLKKVGAYAPTPGDIIMLSGCQDTQTSADIKINGKGNGALTFALIKVLSKANYDITCDELLINVRDYIKNNNLSDQIPCLSFGRSVDISRKFSL